MSISQNFPSSRPSLNLNFARSKKLDPRITFTRSSTATFVDEDGLVKRVATDTPRFEHIPSTGESLGLLIEESRSNLVTYSEQFDNAAWTKSNAGITTNTSATTAPDGNTTAEKLVENTSNALHIVYQTRNGSNETVTFSVFAKAAERTQLLLQISNFVNADSNVAFNLSTGTVGTLSPNNADYTNNSASIIPYPNGWYRCILTTTKGSVNTNNIPTISILNASGQLTYTGDGTSGIYLWGAQLEAGSFPTSYMSTVASTVTRSADVASITGANFSSWYNPNESSVFWSGRLNATLGAGIFGAMYSIDALPINGNTLRGYYNPSNLFGSYVQVEPGTINNSNGITAAINTNQRMATRYKQNDFAVCNNGDSPKSFNINNYPTGLRVLNIGNNPGTGIFGVQTIGCLIYYPIALSNSQLQELTK